MTAADPVLDVRSLSRAYGGLRAVDDLSFQVPRGVLWGLIGPNGAGKSTTMRIIAGLQEADAGHVRICGEDVIGHPERARSLCGLTPQDPALFEHLTAEETLQVVAHLRGVPDDVARARIDHWLAVMTLGHAARRPSGEYSGGMKKKLAIGCALLARPPLVVLDESFNGLDPESCDALERELRAYCADGGTVLLSTHLLDMLQRIADGVTLIRAGRHIASIDRTQMDELIPSSYSSLARYYLDAASESRTRASAGSDNRGVGS